MGFLIGQDALLDIVVFDLILLFEPIVQFVFEVIADVFFVDFVCGEIPRRRERRGLCLNARTFDFGNVIGGIARLRFEFCQIRFESGGVVAFQVF